MTHRSTRFLLLATASVGAMMLAAPAQAQRLERRTVDPAAAAARAAQAQAQQRISNAQRTRETFERVARARQAAEAAQLAARMAAQARESQVPNGLGRGGLQVADGATPGSALWQGAEAPTQTTGADGRVQVRIGQNRERAILNWASFNVGRETDLTFDQQGNTSWAVLNRVLDASPSQILGSIRADGTVLILNQSGVLFSGTAQANTRNLLAAAANMSDGQFTTRGIYSEVVSGNLAPSFTEALGDVRVEAGARIATTEPGSVLEGGGYVMLLGSEVENAGTIVTPEGQTLLAAGNAFALKPGFSTEDNQQSTTRGSEVVVTLGEDTTAGLVTNTGLIEARQGDITLAGRQAEQDGVLYSTTDVTQRGTIHLTAVGEGTRVTIGEDSTTAILPMLESGETALDAQRIALAQTAVQGNSSLSQITIASAEDIWFQSGSVTIANGGYVFANAADRLQVDDGALIDVSGVRGVLLPASAANILVEIQGNELRDSPLNRDDPGRPLFNQDVWIDLNDLILVPAGTGGATEDRYYTRGGLLEVSGYVAQIERGIGEWTAVGGRISLTGDSIVAQHGATFDISGGSIDYAPGNVLTTRVLGSDGRLYSIGNAPAFLRYLSVGDAFVVGQAKWGYAETHANPLARSVSIREDGGYTVGRDAGELRLAANTQLFEAQIRADVVQGERQQASRPDLVADSFHLPQQIAPRAGQLTVLQAADVRFGTNIAASGNGVAIDVPPVGERTGTAWFDVDRLNNSMLGGISVTSDSIAVEAPLVLGSGSTLYLGGTDATINVDDDIVAHGGSIVFEGQTSIASGVLVDLTGAWTNARLDPFDLSNVAFRDGGSFSVRGNFVLEEGASIDVSSGGALLEDGSLLGGRGGSVEIRGLQEDGVAASLDGDIRAFGLSGSGTFSLNSAQAIRIGIFEQPDETNLLQITPDLFQSGFTNYVLRGEGGVEVADGTTIEVLAPAYRLSSRSILVESGREASDALDVWLPPLFAEDPIRGVLTQRVGANLSLIASNEWPIAGRLPELTIGKDSVVALDPGQSLRLEALGQLSHYGTLSAPGGEVALLNVSPLAIPGAATFDTNNLSIWLDGASRIDVAGRAYVATDRLGRRYGTILEGGSVLIGSEGGERLAQDDIPSTPAHIIVREGARVDASGASAVLDLPQGFGGSTAAARTVNSNGGLIAFHSYAGIFLDGELLAHAGGSGAAGGLLSVSTLTPRYNPNPALTLPDELNQLRNLLVSQEQLPSGLADDLIPGAADPALVVGARLGVDRVVAGGFDSLALNAGDLLSFEGSVSLEMGRSLHLRAIALTLSEADTRVTLEAPYVALQNSFEISNTQGQSLVPGIDIDTNANIPRIEGSALTLIADHIDVTGARFGAAGRRSTTSVDLISAYPALPISAPTFDSVSLVSRGDIRFLDPDGPSLSFLGFSPLLASGEDLLLRARQIYPGTGVNAEITAAGLLRIEREGADLPQAPQSVLGRLALFAPEIEQAGVLRAPFGLIELGRASDRVQLLSGSITSSSGAGLLFPFGGTLDGVRYTYGGFEVTFNRGGVDGQVELQGGNFPEVAFRHGITLNGSLVDVAVGATVDLSGGGDLLGGRFVPGRGGSIDVLANPLAAKGPGYDASDANNGVFAIIPGFHGDYAPINPERGAGDPEIGQQITLADGIPGLPAGTYTLLPSNYALLPGAFRVEIGNAVATPLANARRDDGSYSALGTLGIANTDITAPLPVELTVTSANVVRTYSGYNETGYSSFIIDQASLFGNVRTGIAADAQTLNVNLRLTDLGEEQARGAFRFNGSALFVGAEGGLNGAARVISNRGMEIRPYDALSSAARVSVVDADLVRLAAPTLSVEANDALVLLAGATMSGSQLLFSGGSLAVEDGVRLTARRGIDPRYGLDSGRYVSVDGGDLVVSSTAVLLDLTSDISGGLMIADGASIHADGTVALAGDAAIGDFSLSAGELAVAVDALNVGSDAALAKAEAAGVLPTGWNLSQQRLATLLRPGTQDVGELTLYLNASLNFFGAVVFDTGAADFTVNAPAIYGLGGAEDTALIRTDRFTWNGVRQLVAGDVSNPLYGSVPPPPVLADGAGTGSGRLAISAREIAFGDTVSGTSDRTEIKRLVLGFASVDLAATERVVAARQGGLDVYRSGTSEESYAGGNLNLTTPLLTSEAGGLLRARAGGAITIDAPADGAVADTAAVMTLGGEWDFDAVQSIALDTAVALPAGRLVLTAQGDIALGERARLDLSGRAVNFFDVTKYSWGGDVVIESAQGAIRQAAGSSIDVSAVNSDAGSLQVTATGSGGAVDLAGTFSGGTSTGYDSGSIGVRARTLADFAGLNARLNAGSVFGERSFVVKTGDLVVGDEVQAQRVTIAADGGSLTVNGTIDASGARVGSIRLAARDDLVLGSEALLDLHVSDLVVDSYGVPIDASNRGYVELTSAAGRIVLAPGAEIDLRSADSTSRGRIEINAPRVAGNDIAIDAAHRLTIRGADSIAVNAFRSYAPANGSVDQAYMDGLHADSRNFIDAALTNGALNQRLAGLSAYGSAFHLRPGIEVRSEGALDLRGEIDLSGYRYGLEVNSAIPGSGEPGVLVLRAFGDLSVLGSLSDGFAPPPATPDDNGWTISNTTLTRDIRVPFGGTLSGASRLPGGANSNAIADFGFSVPQGTQLRRGVAIPFEFVSNATIVVPGWAQPLGWVAAADIVQPDGQVVRAGERVTTSLPAGTRFASGSILPSTSGAQTSGSVAIRFTNVPAGTPLNVFNQALIAPSGNVAIPAGATLPTGTQVVGSFALRPAGSDGRQGQLFAVAAMLPQGAGSWSMRLVSGADLHSADTRTLVASSALGAGDLILDDLHFAGPAPGEEAPSVVRTGTGYLDLLAGRDLRMETLFGVYTAGTQGTDGAIDFDRIIDPTYFGARAAIAEQHQTYLPSGGGDLTLVSQRDMRGASDRIETSFGFAISSNEPGNWLWRQGGAEIGRPTSWSINFGTYVRPTQSFGNPGTSGPYVIGFTGFGALGGGNVSVIAGGDAGDRPGTALDRTMGSGLTVAVGSAGRVVGGSLVQTGGGDIDIKVAGSLNDLVASRNLQADPALNSYLNAGVLTNLRGDIDVFAASIGAMRLDLSQPNGSRFAGDPRPIAVNEVLAAASGKGGPFVAIGDGVASLSARSDVVLATALDPGRVPSQGFERLGDSSPLNVDTWFTLWTDRSAVRLLSAGGDVAPFSHLGASQVNTQRLRDNTVPGNLSAVALSGSIGQPTLAGIAPQPGTPGIVLAPTSSGTLELLARNSILFNNEYISLSGADDATLATPARPGYQLRTPGSASNATAGLVGGNGWTGAGGPVGLFGNVGELFRFGPNTASPGFETAPGAISRIYALVGDVSNLRFGARVNRGTSFAPVYDYVSAKPLQMRAGRDIVLVGGPAIADTQTSLIVHDDPLQVSVMAAGRDLIYVNSLIYGPGTLEVTAGRNIYQGARGSLISAGPLAGAAAGDLSGGASIALSAGAGAVGPSFDALAELYLDAANLADPERPLADQPGKVAKTYEAELLAWLEERYGYAGGAAGARSYFDALAPEQQRIFLRDVYYNELRSGGREYNDPDSRRFRSYLRGRQAIATLFPTEGGAGNPIDYAGSLIMFSERNLGYFNGVYDPNANPNDGGIRIDLDPLITTQFGGNVDILVPGGQTLIGIEGVVPAASSGLLTQGSGDVRVYSEGSILLGLSRIFTTFGGDILLWSAEGDINAGRGANGTIVFAPARLVYDPLGNVALSPTAPTTGAGIGTLNPIPEVPPGDVDLVAPLGTVDAGEAGIRVSGNINIAALRVVNAANIEVQGEAVGIPQVAAVNVGALTRAGNVGEAVSAEAERLAERARPRTLPARPTIITARLLGFGEE